MIDSEAANNDSVDVLTIYTSFEDIHYDHLPLRKGQKKLGKQLYDAGTICERMNCNESKNI